MTRRLVLDASVAVKWFHDEEFTSEALKIRESADKGRVEIIVPPIFPYEVINALRKPPNLFDKEQLMSASESIELRDLLGEKADKGDLNAALELTFKYAVNPYDASYLLMAKRFKTRVVTADRKLVERLGKEELTLFIGSSELENHI